MEIGKLGAFCFMDAMPAPEEDRGGQEGEANRRHLSRVQGLGVGAQEAMGRPQRPVGERSRIDLLAVNHPEDAFV